MIDSKQKGFTLIEAIVVVAIVGIIAAIAWPLYEEQTQKSKRTDAVAGLTITANEMEKYYSDNATYVMTDAECDANIPTTSPKGFYTITGCKDATADNFTLTATQVNVTDTDCATLTLSNTGIKGKTTTSGNTVPVQRCWGG